MNTNETEYISHDDAGITDEVVEKRRRLTCPCPPSVIPAASATAERRRPLKEVNREGQKRQDAKIETAQTLWLPAVNAHGGLGRWAFVEIQDPWHCMDEIRKAMQ